MWLPPSIDRELRERTRSFNEDILRSIVVDDRDPLLREFTRRLQEFSPRLLMVRAREAVVPGVPMKPGYYHVLVRTDDAPWNIAVVEGEGGEFIEPTSRVFEKLVEGNMQHAGVRKRYKRLQREEHDREEHRKANDREERREHLHDLVNAYTRTSVSLNPETPWRQNQAGRRDVGGTR